MKIQIKHRFTNEVLFEHEQDDNVIKLTVELAVKQNVDLRGADLWGAGLRGAYLQGANLWMADLQVANLWEANLQGANLQGTDLQEADLQRANLWGASLIGANLQWTDLQRTNLQGADLREANLQGAYLRGAYLQGADLEVKNPPISDHYFISEILIRQAETEAQKDFASRIRMELSHCCEFFVLLAKKKKVYKWAKKILCQWDEFKNIIDTYEKTGSSEVQVIVCPGPRK